MNRQRKYDMCIQRNSVRPWNKKEILPFSATWVSLEKFTLNETNQAQKDRHCMIALYVWSKRAGMWSQMGLRSITANKASGGGGIPVELFQILEDDAVKVLHSICQKIWKTQQRPQDWKRSVFIPIPKKGNAKECSKYWTVALISHASRVMFKILQAWLQ